MSKSYGLSYLRICYAWAKVLILSVKPEKLAQPQLDVRLVGGCLLNLSDGSRVETHILVTAYFEIS